MWPLEGASGKIQGWLTSKNIVLGIGILFGLGIIGAALDPDNAGGSDAMKRDAVKAAKLSNEFFELGATEMTEMTVALQNKTKLKPNAARKKRMDDLSEQIEAIKAKYSGSGAGEFKALMDAAMK